MPSNHLETLLWAEAERHAEPAASTRPTSAPSARWSRRNTGSGSSPRRTAASSTRSRTRPYLRASVPALGRSAASRTSTPPTLADVVAFHAAYYRPDNATLIVAGDFDPRAARRLGRQVLRPDAAAGRAAAGARGRRAGVDAPTGRSRVTAPNVPLPAVAAVWLAPPLTERRRRRRCRSPRRCSPPANRRGCNQALVYRQQVATQAGFERRPARRPRPADRLRHRRRRQVARPRCAPPCSPR